MVVVNDWVLKVPTFRVEGGGNWQIFNKKEKNSSDSTRAFFKKGSDSISIYELCQKQKFIEFYDSRMNEHIFKITYIC